MEAEKQELQWGPGAQRQVSCKQGKVEQKDTQ